MSEDIKTSYLHLLKIASALEQLENIQNEVGQTHPGTDNNANAKYEDVQDRLMQPYSHVREMLSGPSQKVVGADEYEEHVAYSENEFKGLNKKYFYPHSKEFRKKSGSFIRKSTGAKIKKHGL